MNRRPLAALLGTVALAALVIGTHPPPHAVPTGARTAVPGGGAERPAAVPRLRAASSAPAQTIALDGVTKSRMALEAAATVSRFCRLVEQHAFAEARSILRRTRVWPRREMRSCSGLRFVSARLLCVRSADALLLDAHLAVIAASDTPTTEAGLWLRFTLRRDEPGQVWLITAVQRRESGPQRRRRTPSI